MLMGWITVGAVLVVVLGLALLSDWKVKHDGHSPQVSGPTIGSRAEGEPSATTTRVRSMGPGGH